MIAPCLRLARNAACYPCWMGSLGARLGQPPAEVAPLGFGGGELERLAVGGRRRSVWPSTEGSAARSRPTNTRTTANTRMNRTPPRIWPNLPSAGAVFPGNPPRITHSCPADVPPDPYMDHLIFVLERVVVPYTDTFTPPGLP